MRQEDYEKATEIKECIESLDGDIENLSYDNKVTDIQILRGVLPMLHLSDMGNMKNGIQNKQLIETIQKERELFIGNVRQILIAYKNKYKKEFLTL